LGGDVLSKSLIDLGRLAYCRFRCSPISGIRVINVSHRLESEERKCWIYKRGDPLPLPALLGLTNKWYQSPE